MGERVQQTVSDAIGDTKTVAASVYNQAADQAQQNAARLGDVIKEQPIVALLIALGIGKLELAGTNMELLLPLIGIALPKTPSYQIKGDLDYADGRIRFRKFVGHLGSSDVQGNIEVDPGPKRPVVTADVTSRQVDLADLGGFLGSEPGRINTPNQTPSSARRWRGPRQVRGSCRLPGLAYRSCWLPTCT